METEKITKKLNKAEDSKNIYTFLELSYRGLVNLNNLTKQGVKLNNQQKPRNFKIHLIGYGHIDIPWQWPLRESIDEGWSTTRSALDRINEYPEFIYTATSPFLFEQIKALDPEMFDEIKQRVTEGRIVLEDGKLIEPDDNIPSGESQIRQLLYGQSFYLKEFGKYAKVGMNPDAFGHAGTLPKILKHGGNEFFVFTRPGRHEIDLPTGPFWWEGDDGTRILTHRIPYEYTMRARGIEQHLGRIENNLDGDNQETIAFYGVGNHGGGPTKETLDKIIELRENNPTLNFSTLEEYFNSARACTDHPVYHGELQRHAPGCYSAGVEIKRLNRQAENWLLASEKINSSALIAVGGVYPAKELQEAGKEISLCQFHDTLGATLTKQDLRCAEEGLVHAAHVSRRKAEEGFLRIAEKIRIEKPEEGDFTPIIVFNPHTWPSKVPVETELYDFKDTDVLVDNLGKEIPVQEIQSAAVAGGRKRICFVANLPALGYRVYRLKRNAVSYLRLERKSLEVSDCGLENERFGFTIDREVGCIEQLYDRMKGLPLFRGKGAVPTVIEDGSDTWGHGKYHFYQGGETFTIIGSPRIVEKGPVRSIIRVTSNYHNSTLVQDFILYAELDGIYVKARLDWHEKHKMLKIKFPVALEARQHTYEAPYGVAIRGEYGDEVTGQSWVDISGIYMEKVSGREPNRDYGISVINDSKYSFSSFRRELGMTITRGTIYCWHEPHPLNQTTDYEFMDQGIQEFSYVILPHDFSWKEAGTYKLAAEFNQPPTVLVSSYKETGNLPTEASFARVEADNVVLNVVKRAENPSERAFILRFIEMHNRTTTTKVQLGDRTFDVKVPRNGLMTLIVPFDKNLPVRETNGLEL
jgi:alpha-mannosidase